MATIRYVVLTPARDEEAHLPAMMASMTAQTLKPTEWIVVNDGSRDRTGEILDAYASEHAWMRALHRPDRGRRLAGAGVVECIGEAYRCIATRDWQFLAKLDADLRFEPTYFERCLGRFQAFPKLGIAGGLIYSARNGRLEVDAKGDPPFHVRGATKIYRRACWDAIGEWVAQSGWDTADELKANRMGWVTGTFRDIELVQQRATGYAYGTWRDGVKNGRGSYLCGYHPLFLLARCSRRLLHGRDAVAAAAIAFGFFHACLSRPSRAVDPETLRYLRGEQWKALRGRPGIYSNRIP